MKDHMADIRGQISDLRDDFNKAAKFLNDSVNKVCTDNEVSYVTVSNDVCHLLQITNDMQRKCIDAVRIQTELKVRKELGK